MLRPVSDEFQLVLGGLARNVQKPSSSIGFPMVFWRRAAASGLLSGHFRATFRSFNNKPFGILE